MKVIVVLESSATDGGAFHQALSAIAQMKRLCDSRFGFEVVTTAGTNLDHLATLGIDGSTVAISRLDRLLTHVTTKPWWRDLQQRVAREGPLERKLLERGADLVYFPTPSQLSGALQRLNYIATVLDLCHRDCPEFPEVRSFGELGAREFHYRTNLPPAVAVVTASEQLSDSIARRYGVDRERLVAMPFSPSPFLEAVGAASKMETLRECGLEEGYFFYPSQFWAHKNHVRILEAMLLLRADGTVVRAAFAGSDHGNRGYLEQFVERHGLQNQVRFLGFVPVHMMRGLYEGCTAVVMPTYFGPTNLPPLEAWSMGKPLIYSAHLVDEVADAAICVDPDDARALATAMQACTLHQERARLVALGAARLEQRDQLRERAEAELLARLRLFESRRRCWA